VGVVDEHFVEMGVDLGEPARVRGRVEMEHARQESGIRDQQSIADAAMENA
jgi:hypothetical protein